jgi:VanZ family protein
MKILRTFAPALAWGILVFVLSATPGRDLPKLNVGALMIDKVAHFVMYGVLSCLLLRGGIPKRYWFWVASIAAIYGLLMEFYQDIFCIDRTFDWGDALANAVGAYGCAWLYLRFTNK